MKEIDDSKIAQVNAELEKRFQTERDEWNDKMISLIHSLKDNSKLSEAQIYQLSYRQQVQEQIVKYSITLEKREEAYDTMWKNRFTDYGNFDYRLNSTEKQTFINADIKAIKLQVKLISIQIDFYKEMVKTLDNLGFAIKNKLEMVSQQLL